MPYPLCDAVVYSTASQRGYGYVKEETCAFDAVWRRAKPVRYRDVAATSKLIKEKNLNCATVQAMTDSEAEGLLSPERELAQKNRDYLQSDMDTLVRSKGKGGRLPVKLMGLAYCNQADAEGCHQESFANTAAPMWAIGATASSPTLRPPSVSIRPGSACCPIHYRRCT